jgi:transposase
LRLPRLVSRFDGNFIHCELPDGSIGAFPSWMMDAEVCSRLSMSTPQLSLEALTDLHNFLKDNISTNQTQTANSSLLKGKGETDLVDSRKRVMQEEKPITLETICRRSYDKDFKINAINLYGSSGRSIHTLARELGIPSATFSKWVRDYRQGGHDSFPGKGQVKSSEEETKFTKSQAACLCFHKRNNKQDDY